MTDSPTTQVADVDGPEPGQEEKANAGTAISVDAPDVAAALGGPVRRHSHGVVETKIPAKIGGVVVGTLVECPDGGNIRVDFALNPTIDPIVARSTVPVIDEDVGREVALLFQDADPSKPIIMGFMQQVSEPSVALESSDGTASVRVEVAENGKRLTLSAEDQITMRCGESSITLTRAGKILLKGKYLSSHSAGVNRIRGGSVQLN